MWRVSSCDFLIFNLLTAIGQVHGWVVFGLLPSHQSNKFPSLRAEAIWVWKEGERSSPILILSGKKLLFYTQQKCGERETEASLCHCHCVEQDNKVEIV